MPSPSSAPTPRRPGSPPPGGGFGLLLALGLCCGLPLLLSAGVLATAGGFLGHPLVLGAGLVLALVGLAPWRRRTRRCRYDAPLSRNTSLRRVSAGDSRVRTFRRAPAGVTGDAAGDRSEWGGNVGDAFKEADLHTENFYENVRATGAADPSRRAGASL